MEQSYLNRELRKESNSHSQSLTPRWESSLTQGKIEEEPRKSLEVFGWGTVKKGDIAKNLERKLSILTWDVIPKPQDLSSTTYGSSAVRDDMASDASSDLFEIENISGTGFPLLMSPASQYAPSEASIERSVVTASAADFSSEYDEKNIAVSGDKIPTTIKNRSAINKVGMGKEVAQKHQNRPSGLLGCKSHKAVRVAESVYRASDKQSITGQLCPSDALGSHKPKQYYVWFFLKVVILRELYCKL